MTLAPATPHDADGLVRLDALGQRRLIADGRLTVLELVQAHLATIAVQEDRIQAWAFLDADHARAQASERDAERRAGQPQGPLFGLPVGVKDVIDTADMPTECGTALLRGRRPGRDATVVARLRAAGAVILGKTVTTELAVYTPGKTRNPCDLERTPGGSSSGSAAAVAAHMVPLALGTQTNGSVIRPAAFCGIVGYKPSFGLIGRSGVLRQAPTFDHVGVLARSLADAALLAEALIGRDEADPDTRPAARPDLLATLQAPWPLAPRLAFARTSAWPEAEPGTQAAFMELATLLGTACETVDLPEPADRAHAAHGLIMAAEMAASFAPLWERGRDRLSPKLRAILENGRTVTAFDYLAALELKDRLLAAIEPLLDSYDAILTPAAPGEAPVGLESTGSPAFCTIWTFLGLPAVTVPLLEGPAGLPMGVQLVGRRGDDARLLRTARWLLDRVAGAEAKA